jgi:hypothetical protein
MADYRRHIEDGRSRHDRDWNESRDDGTYRSDDRDYHDRYRSERGDLYARTAADQVRHYPEDWGVQHVPDGSMTPSFNRLERGGYWRRYENRPSYKGRGPKGYQRSDDRIREEICDCMTDDSMLDASEIVVEVKQGEVMLSGSVTSREQKRRAEDVADRICGVRDVSNQLRVMREPAGHSWAPDSSRASGPGTTSSQPVAEAYGKGTPGKSTTSTTA